MPIPEYLDQVDAGWVSAALSVRRPGAVVEKLEQVGDRPGAGNKLFLRATYLLGHYPDSFDAVHAEAPA